MGNHHRKEQGVFADYVILMGYDEHYGGSPEAGSVASYEFVKNGIAKTVEEVPANKVINAVPFFTRVWKETPKTESELAAQAGTDEAEIRKDEGNVPAGDEDRAGAYGRPVPPCFAGDKGDGRIDRCERDGFPQMG